MGSDDSNIFENRLVYRNRQAQGEEGKRFEWLRNIKKRNRLLPSPCIGLSGSMTFAGPGGYPRGALSLPIYGLTANDCRWVPLMIGVRKRTKATSRTMQKSILIILPLSNWVKMDLSKNYGFECKGFDTVCLTMELDLEYKRSFLASLFAPCSSR